LLASPVTVIVTWRPLLKLVPRVPAETFMERCRDTEGGKRGQLTGVRLAMRPP
jgi:hypothetical protein